MINVVFRKGFWLFDAETIETIRNSDKPEQNEIFNSYIQEVCNSSKLAGSQCFITHYQKRLSGQTEPHESDPTLN